MKEEKKKDRMRQYCDDPFDKFHSVHIFVCKNGKGRKPVLLNVVNETQIQCSGATQMHFRQEKVRTRHVVSNRVWISGRCCCCDRYVLLAGASKLRNTKTNDSRPMLRSHTPEKIIIYEVN